MTTKMANKPKANGIHAKKKYLFFSSISNAKHTEKSTNNQAKTSYEI
jgi:hypothetical protein